jgi:hypothetical protein
MKDQTNNPLNYYSKYWLRIKEGVWEWGREDGDGIEWEEISGIEWEGISEELYNNILHLYNIYLNTTHPNYIG